ncbi:hypothetical protein BH11PSE11_BH11PSE11_36260 [soil metagenome]
MATPQISPTGTNGTTGTWERTVEKASAGVHSTIDKVVENAHPVVDRLSSGAHTGVDKISEVATRTSKVVAEKAVQLKDLHGKVMADARTKVRERPVTALAIAAGAGYILSRFFRSR